MIRKINDWGGNILAFILVLTVNSLANLIPIGGQTTEEISDKYPTLFTPAGFTFSIWSLIYLSLFLFIIFQALPSQRENKEIVQIQKMFVINCLANAAWIFVWHYEFIILSFLVMIVILLTLISIYRSINSRNHDGKSAFTRFIFLQLPFSLYTGWITVAFIANLSIVQVDLGWNSLILSHVNWTLIKLAFTGSIGSLVLLIRKDFIFALVIAWASFGISVKQVSAAQISGSAFSISIMMIILVIFYFLNFVRKEINIWMKTSSKNDRY